MIPPINLLSRRLCLASGKYNVDQAYLMMYFMAMEVLS